MSWSKFNDSFNSLKGQLTTFVQDIVEPEDEDSEQVESRESVEGGVDQWQAVCTAQENEVIRGRKWILELDQDTHEDEDMVQDRLSGQGSS